MAKKDEYSLLNGNININVTGTEEIAKLERKIEVLNEELNSTYNNLRDAEKKLDDFANTDVGKLEKSFNHLTNNALREFKKFIRAYNLDNVTNEFDYIFKAISKGTYTSQEAIRELKSEFGHLLKEIEKPNSLSLNDIFDTSEIQSYINKFESLFSMIENMSEKINKISNDNILNNSNGLINIEDESLKNIINLFEKIESSLSSMKAVFVDVGDGEEFSPLLKMINNVQESIDKLSVSVKGIGLNMNIDVGSDSEMEAKVQSKISNALQAYQRLFDHIKMSGAGGSMINTNFFEFDINQYDTMMAKLQAYRKFIENMRNEAKAQFNGKDVLFQGTDKSYWTSASAAMGQVTKAFKEMNASADTSPLENLFGGKTDLTEVVTQLNLIVDKLGEISTTASEFKNVFANGFNVSASVEEIEKLTSRVKELEDELSKVKVSSTSPVKTNISSGNTTTPLEVKNNEEVANAIRKKKEELASYELQVEELRYEIEKLSKTESESYGFKKAFPSLSDKQIDSFKERIYNSMFGTDKSRGYGLQKYLNMGKVDDESVIKSYRAWSEELDKVGYKLSELRQTSVGVEADIIPINGKAVTNAEEFRKVLFSISNAVSDVSSEKVVELSNQILELETKISSIKAEIKSLSSTSSTPIKDTFQGDKIQETVSVADKLEEEIQEITVATDKAGKALEEYKEKWKVLKQVGDVGDDKYSATFEKNAGQIESVIWKAKRDADGNVLFDSNGEKEYEMLSVTISNYQKLESVIVNADNELRKLEDRRQNLLKQNPTASTSGLDAQIAYQKNYISLLEQTVKHISQADEYLLEEQQIIEARNKAEKEYQLTKGSKQDESVAKDYQKRNDAITKANRLLNTQEKTVEHIAKTYDKALNPDLEKSVNNPNDLAELAQKKSEIQTLINQLKNAPRDASNEQEYLRLEKLIAEYKDLADYKKKANNPTKQELGGQKLETLVAQTVAEYDKLIIRAEKYGDATKGIVEKLKQQRDLLAQTDSNGKYTANANDFYSARDVLKVQKADFGVFEASEKAIKIREKELEAVRKLSAEKQKLQEKDRQSTVDSALKDQLSAWKDIQNIREKIAKTTNEEELSILNQQKKNAQQQYLSAEKVLKANVDLYDNEARLKQLEDVRLETNRKLVAYGETQVKAIGNLVKNEQAHLDKLRPSDGNRSVDFEKAVQEYNKAIIALREFHATLDPSTPLTKEQSAKYDELASSLQKARVEMEKFSAAEKGSTEGSRWKEIDKITKYLEKNTRISKIAKQQLEDLVNTLKNVSGVNVDNIHLQFNKIAEAERAAGREGKRFWDIFKEKVVYGAAANMAGMIGIYDIINVGREAVDIVIDLNTQITELAKVSEATSSQIYDDFNSYAEIAKDVGGTISDTISATADWSRNGYNIPDSKELAEVALLYKNVGDGIDIDTANESLISTLRGFKMEAEDAMHIIDVFNEVSNNEAISAGGIGEALKRSAASFSAANTSLEQSVALITATNSVLQDEEKTGNMWRTVSARIRGAKTELEEAGLETEGMVESTSKLQGLIKGMTGFDILEEDGKTFKDIYDIVLNIGKEWENLSDIDQAALLEALAGKQQSNALAAALSNVDILEKSYKEAMNAQGSALEEQAKYQESLQYSIDRTKASLEELANDFLSSDFLKGLIDSGDKLINILDWIIDKFGVLGTLTAVGGGILSANGIG